MHRTRRIAVMACSLTLVALIAAPADIGGLASAAPPAPFVCSDTIVYGVRGSGENDPNTFHDGLGGPVSAFVSTLKSLYPDGVVTATANSYPAVDPKRFDPNYGSSVEEGVGNTIDDVTRIMRACTRSTLVMAGYSQGADVLRRALPRLPAWNAFGHVGPEPTVVFFGDPNWVPDEKYLSSFHDEPLTVRSNGGFSLEARGALQNNGVRGATTLSPPPGIGGRPAWVLSYCNDQDLICQFGGRSARAHTNYDGWARAAAYAMPSYIGVNRATRTQTESASVEPASRMAARRVVAAKIRVLPHDWTDGPSEIGCLVLVDGVPVRALRVARRSDVYQVDGPLLGGRAAGSTPVVGVLCPRISRQPIAEHRVRVPR